MSRVGNMPVGIPKGVKVEVRGRDVVVQGSKGELKLNLPERINVELKGNEVWVSKKGAATQERASQGTIRALVANMVKGVSDGWSRELEMVGTGYRAEAKGGELVLTIGFSHPVVIKAPDGISFKVEKTKITVEGIDKHLVGQIASDIRAVRPPEPYKGKGIRYVGEYVRRKAGKAAKTQGAV